MHSPLLLAGMDNHFRSCIAQLNHPSPELWSRQYQEASPNLYSWDNAFILDELDKVGAVVRFLKEGVAEEDDTADVVARGLVAREAIEKQLAVEKPILLCIFYSNRG